MALFLTTTRISRIDYEFSEHASSICWDKLVGVADCELWEGRGEFSTTLHRLLRVARWANIHKRGASGSGVWQATSSIDDRSRSSMELVACHTRARSSMPLKACHTRDPDQVLLPFSQSALSHPPHRNLVLISRWELSYRLRIHPN